MVSGHIMGSHCTCQSHCASTVHLLLTQLHNDVYYYFNIAMNRMKAADVTQLRYLFDMYLLCIYNKNIIENP